MRTPQYRIDLVPHPVTPTLTFVGDVPARVTEVFGATQLNGKWYFPAFRPAVAQVVQCLKAVTSGKITATPAAREHILAMREDRPLPEDFTFVTAPYQHQRDALTWLYNRPRAGIFYAPGLGKCKITVDLYRLVREPMLILCPAVVLYTWAREFVTHGQITDTCVLDQNKEERLETLARAVAGGAPMPAATMITYESAVLHAAALSKLPFGVLVLDESHRIKSINSGRTRTALFLAERIRRRVLLSGTPSLGTPFGLYPQLRLLGRYFCPENWTEFRKSYGIYDDKALASGKMYGVLGYKNLEVLRERVTSVCLRRYLEDCVDLPPRVIRDVPFSLQEKERDTYNDIAVGECDDAGIGVRAQALAGYYRHRHGPYLKSRFVYTPDSVTRLLRLEQVASGFVGTTRANPGICNECANQEGCIENRIRPFTSKCLVAQEDTTTKDVLLGSSRQSAFAEVLEEILEDPNNKVIVWTRFLNEHSEVCKLLDLQNIKHVRVRGGMDLADFEAAMRQFNTDEDCRVYVGQVASGIGVTLNAANYVIYYTLPWSLEQYDQSLARNYRINQTRPVVVLRLIAEGSIDEDKALALDQKVDIDAMLTQPDETPCPLHKTYAPSEDASCTCRSSIRRVISRLAPIGYARKEVLESLRARGWCSTNDSMYLDE